MRDRDIPLLEEMREQFDLHPLAVEDAQQGHQRPKIEEYGDLLFAVLRMVEPGMPDLTVGEVDIFAGPNYILSVRSGVEKGFDDVRARCEAEPELLACMFASESIAPEPWPDKVAPTDPATLFPYLMTTMFDGVYCWW